jgi:hypothetical protein
MPRLDELAEAALSGDALRLRSLAQDWLEENQQLQLVMAPITKDPSILAVAAAFVEMFAERANQVAPAWTRDVLEAPEPLFLLREARTMKRLRKLCEEQSPLPLRRRRIYVPPDFLTFA